MTDPASYAALCPTYDRSVVAIAAAGDGPGFWAGGPSAGRDGDGFVLAYRLRRPVADGRGYAIAIARSDDGVTFTEVARLLKEDFDTASFERPALVRRPDGGWRIYLSLSTEGSKHWWIDALDADTPEKLPLGTRSTILPGDERTAVKDPVVHVVDGRWQMWACVHPIVDPAEADQMSTFHLTSADGIDWDWGPEALAGKPDTWDQRGARIAEVLIDRQPPLAYYDGRVDKSQNWEEFTGLAVGIPGPDAFAPVAGPVRSPHGAGALRYLSAVPLGDRTYRLYYEASRPDGGHDLVTEVVPAG